MSVVAEPIVEERILLDDANWTMYERFLETNGDRSIRCAYDRGRLEIRCRVRSRERRKPLVSSMIESIALALNLPLEPRGSMTIRREDLAVGLQPDACFHVTHAMRMLAKTQPDFTVDPPPDLAIEVDVSGSSLDRLSIYQRLGVPEVWMLDGHEVQFLRLQAGEYQARDTSSSFAFLGASDLNRHLPLLGAIPYMEIHGRFNAWLRSIIPTSGE